MLRAFRPAVAGAGPRCIEMVVALSTHSHLIDPILARVYSLITLVGRMPEVHIALVQHCYDERMPAYGMASALAAWLHAMHGRLIDGVWHSPHEVPLPLQQPVEQCDLWKHNWRNVLRHWLIANTTLHRREYTDLAHGADLDLTRAYLLTLPPGRERTALELI
eukprot:6446129-Amphidinium_carterae.1